MPEDLPHVTVAIPTLDEERYLERCLESLLEDDYPRELLEVLIVDGGSADRTVEIAERLGREQPFVRVLHNPAKLQSAAFNLAMREADPRSDYLIRCDAHARYAPRFISHAVDSMRRTGAVLVAFTEEPESEGAFQAAVAFAQHTPLGVGNSLYRLGDYSGWIDHGHHGCFSREAVEAVGGYDESFSHNEDSELSRRLADAGGKIWLDQRLAMAYYPRETPRALTRQYWLYGKGRAGTCIKLGAPPLPRQALPPLLVLWHAALALLALRRRSIRPLAPAAAYAAALGLYSARGAVAGRRPSVLLAPLAFAIMHHAWGAGFLARIGGHVVARLSRFRR